MADGVDAAMEQSHAALREIVRGNAEPFQVLYSRVEDVTLGNPFGPFVRGRQAVADAVAAAAGRYRDGEVEGFDFVARHEADNLACVVEGSGARWSSTAWRTSPSRAGFRAERV
jgi:hypothetical protein